MMVNNNQIAFSVTGAAPDLTQTAPALNFTLTLLLESDEDYHYINGLRTKHYPPDLLFNPAHIGIFTRLTVPPALVAEVHADLAEMGRKEKRFTLQLARKPQLWGKCVVLPVMSSPLESVRSALNTRWAGMGIVHPSERNGYQPHFTVHGRVSAAAARAAHDRVSQSFAARAQVKRLPRGRALGFQLWEYQEGMPWRHVATFPFTG
ncbi:hypothetical protein BKA93DRAFT_764462 [Sparassis latifolia]